MCKCHPVNCMRQKRISHSSVRLTSVVINAASHSGDTELVRPSIVQWQCLAILDCTTCLLCPVVLYIGYDWWPLLLAIWLTELAEHSSCLLDTSCSNCMPHIGYTAVHHRQRLRDSHWCKNVFKVLYIFFSQKRVIGLVRIHTVLNFCLNKALFELTLCNITIFCAFPQRFNDYNRLGN